MQLLHHYVQKGFSIEYLLNLSVAEKLFFRASLEQYHEERAGS